MIRTPSDPLTRSVGDLPPVLERAELAHEIDELAYTDAARSRVLSLLQADDVEAV